MDEVAKKVQEYFERYPKRSYQKGQILIHAGDTPQAIYYLVSGRVRQYDISYRGDEIVVNVFKERAFFPMLVAVAEVENRYFFAAEAAIEVRVAPKAEVLAFMQANPDVAYDLLRRLYIGIDGLLGRMTHLMAGSAKSRVMYELILECRRFGTPEDNGTVRVTVKEIELAAHAGLSRETVSRELQKIAADGLITIGRGSITVHSNELEEQLGAEL